MKNKIHKLLGVSLTLVIALSLVAGFALPVAGAEFEGEPNEWTGFVADRGPDSDWFIQGSWSDGEHIDGISAITEAINGDLYAYVETDGDVGPYDHIFKSEDGGRTWAETKYCDATDGVEGDYIFDMVCSSIDEDIVYATDGQYVYKTTDGGDTWTFVAKDSLEEALEGECGCTVNDWRTITCIDVTYDDDDNPFLFIGTRTHMGGDGTTCNNTSFPGNVYWIGEAGYPATWTDLGLDCYSTGDYDAFAIGCAPDWADSHETYVVVSNGSETHVVSTIGVYCSWTEFAELLWDCLYQFDIWAASRIAFPDDWEDTEILFVGVTDDNTCNGTNCLGGDGGDVYYVTDGSALDMNVAGITSGCLGIEAVDIISLDIKGDTDDASLIAGSYCSPYVYYSEVGGWEWDRSAKEPTGNERAYVIWYEDTALAATDGDECAVSMSCGEEVGEFWNQISLIATDMDEVRWIDHSPGYVCDSETMFMLTVEWGYSDFGYQACYTEYDENQSLWRYDGTYWERVYASFIAGSDIGNDSNMFMWVEVSPDFNDTNTLYLANRRFEMWRSQDAGCSWDKLTFPCSPREEIGVIEVIDEDTVIAGGKRPDHGWVFKTTRHGARPWDAYEVTDATDAKSFALEPGYEDPGSILLGTENQGQVFISEDGGEEWELVGDCTDVLERDTYVIFDPSYATNNIIYAAGGNIIARCIIDTDADWADQEWEVICNGSYGEDNHYRGIAAAGDTALYVLDQDEYDSPNDGGVVRSLNPDTDDVDDVVFERVLDGLVEENDHEGSELGAKPGYLWLTCDVSDDGCAENVLWSLDLADSYEVQNDNGEWKQPCTYIWVYEDTLAAPVVLDTPIDEQKLTTTDQATLSWNELCDADCYEVSLWSYCAECPDEKLAVDLCLDCVPGDSVTCGPEVECEWWDEYLEEWYCCPCTEEICIVVEDLEPGTTYYWQVRVCQGKPTLSKWSEERTFMTAMLAVPFAELCSPPCGDQDIILTPNFAWEAVDGATGYDIELATTETFTAGVITGSPTVNAWVLTDPLDYATTYYWRVRAEKDGVVSDWTVCLFTTREAPVPAPPPVVVEPTPPAPVVPAPIIEFPPTPSWVWAIIGIGTALVVVVIVLTVRTRRPPA